MMAPVYVVRGFLSVDQMAEMNAFVDTAIRDGKMGLGVTPEGPNGVFVLKQSRFSTRVPWDGFKYPQVVFDVRRQITDMLGLQDVAQHVAGAGSEGIIVNCMHRGADIYEHVDGKNENDSSLDLLRCNVMSRASDDGGELVIEGRTIPLSAGDLHCYLASTVRHRVTTVRGATPRVQWLFGYWIKRADWMSREEKLRNADRNAD